MSKEEKTLEKKTSDKPKRKKPNKIAKWFKELKSEFKKVTWPSKKKVINNTGVVLATILVSTIFVGGFDFGLRELFSLILGL